MLLKSTSYIVVTSNSKLEVKFACFGSSCNKNKIINWTHQNCGRNIYLTHEGNVYCQYHPSEVFIAEWDFGCCEQPNCSSNTGQNNLSWSQAVNIATQSIMGSNCSQKSQLLKRLQNVISEKWMASQEQKLQAKNKLSCYN